MIPKAWRDYKVEFRPIVILAWLACSPAMLLPVMWFYTRDNVEWAAWVQAVGSVAAILVAVWVSNRDAVSRKDDVIVSDYQYMSKALVLATYGQAAVKHSADYILEGQIVLEKLAYKAAVLRNSLEDLEAVDVMCFESEKAIHAFLAIKRAVLLAAHAIETEVAGKSVLDRINVKGWGANVDDSYNQMCDGVMEYVRKHPRFIDSLPE